jgi:hypothetical protein
MSATVDSYKSIYTTTGLFLSMYTNENGTCEGAFLIATHVAVTIKVTGFASVWVPLSATSKLIY